MNRINKISLHRLNAIAETNTGVTIESSTYQRGQVLFEEGKYAKGLFYIESGTVLLNRTNQMETEVVMNIIGRDNFIGFLPLFKKNKHTSSAIAMEDNCQVKFISKTIFNKALTDIRFVNGWIKILCDTIALQEDHLVDFKTKDSSERLAAMLISLTTTYKKSAKIPSQIITIKKIDLARLIGIAPETLSRRLADFEKEGLIELHVKGIKVIDPEQLSNYAHGVI